MQTHPERGERVLSKSEEFAEMARIVATTTNDGTVTGIPIASPVKRFR